MTHDHQLQQAILAELHHSGGQLAARIVVTVVADEVVLSGELDSFADKLAVAAMVGEVDGVRQVTDQTDARLDMERNQRLLLAARRAIGGATPIDESSSDPDGRNGMTVSMDDGLLMVTGELDWRQRGSAPRDGRESGISRAAAANIADDILQMLPRCFFSTSRAVR